MKKKIYYIVYLICQFCLGLYGFFNANEFAKEQIKIFEDANSLGEMSFETVVFSYKFLMIISIIISILLLYFVLKNDKLQRTKLVIILLVASIFVSSSIVALLAAISLGLVFKEPKSKENRKEKCVENIPNISNLKVTRKDYISGVILILVYFGQIYLVPLINKLVNNPVFSTVFYEIIIFGVAIWAFFERYKRDYKYLKKSFKVYLKSSFKYWGLMYLCVLGVAIIQILLGVEEQSANQTTLETLPLWYLIPSAIIFAPVVEEALFRGVLRRFIKNDIIFIIVSGISFGLLHTLLSEETLYMAIIQSLNYVTMGMVLAYSYTKTNNIFTSMMIHAIQNTIGVLAILLSNFI